MGSLTTKIENTTETPMKLVIMDQFAIRRTKMIQPKNHIYLSKWDGIVSDNIEISYEVYPGDRPDGRIFRATFLPIDVYDNSDIKISCDMETGRTVVLSFVHANGSFQLQRTRVARWLKDLFSRLA